MSPPTRGSGDRFKPTQWDGWRLSLAGTEQGIRLTSPCLTWNICETQIRQERAMRPLHPRRGHPPLWAT